MSNVDREHTLKHSNTTRLPRAHRGMLACSEHHATHIWELNKALLKHPELQSLDLVTLNRQVGTDKIPADVAAVIRRHGKQDGVCTTETACTPCTYTSHVGHTWPGLLIIWQCHCFEI
jgi:hypothetical protein